MGVDGIKNKSIVRNKQRVQISLNRLPQGRRSSICTLEGCTALVTILQVFFEFAKRRYNPAHPPYNSPVLNIRSQGCLCMLSLVRRYAQYRARGPPMKTVRISSDTTVGSALPHRTSACMCASPQYRVMTGESGSSTFAYSFPGGEDGREKVSSCHFERSCDL